MNLDQFRVDENLKYIISMTQPWADEVQGLITLRVGEDDPLVKLVEAYVFIPKGFFDLLVDDFKRVVLKGNREVT